MDLTLVLTHACNLGCDYCFAGRKFARTMSLETGRQALLLALEETRDGRLDVAFFGGEPLLELDLLLALADEARALAAARGVTCGLSVTTNGTVLTEAAAEALAARAVHVALSIDGVPEAQDITRPYAGGRSSAAAVAQALDLALRRLDRVGVIAVVDPRTVRHLAAGVRSLVERGVTQLTLNPNWTAPWTELDREAWRAAYAEIARFWQERIRAGRPFVLSTIDPKIHSRLRGAERTRSCCGYGARELAVAPSGRVYGCGRRVGEDSPGSVECLGSIRSGVDACARRALPTPGLDLPPECQACAFRDRCANDCGCTNLETSGDAAAPGGLLCWHETMSIPLADRVASELYAERDPTFMARFYLELTPTS